ncbi:DUF835 domain-containing protein [Thermococcus sp. 21S7]|uniref:DUF835 domain-containing protein n=1 Tax=Thermococcus sp. 21S7 TaxID=1638221 RepID=UPI00143A8277|nr:DUF835 domain-containing protein [Thermococcus sp. 21S7]NJE61324.1 DUF835 domain-containing protein [Thermococcus sp. 21S7]
MIGYEHIKLGAEIVSFLSLSGLIYLAFSLRKSLGGIFDDKIIKRFFMGAFVFWSGYFVNVMNDVVPLKVLKILDDALGALGILIIAIVFRSLKEEIELKVKPTVVLNGQSSLPPGAYLMKPIPAKKILKTLAGKKVIALTRFPQKWKQAGVPYIWLSNVEDSKSISPTRLAAILHIITQEVESDTFVIVEGVEYLILQNGPTGVLRFLLSLKDHVLKNGGGIVLIVDPESVDHWVYKILEKEFKVLQV